MKSRRLVSSIRRENEFTGASDRRGDGSEMPNCCQNGNGWRSQVLPGRGAGRLNTDGARSLGDRGSPIASRRQRSAHAWGVLRANARAGRSPGSPGALPIEGASEWQFWELSSRPLNRPVRRTRNGILRVGIPVQENIPRNIPVPENIPRNIPAWGSQKVPRFQGLTKNIPNIPNIPAPAGIFCEALILIRKR